MSKSPTKANTGAVVVTYHPDERLPERLAPVASQVDRVLILDNGSNPMEVSMLEECSRLDGVELALLQQNVGVASALNRGLAWAHSMGYDWLLCLDQDSIVYPHLIDAMAEVYAGCDESGRIGIIGANYRDKLTGLPFLAEEQAGELRYTEAVTVITSGSLLSLEAASAAGAFRDDFFIDHVDDEYCLRLRRAEFKVIMTREPLMEHTVGHPKNYKLLGKRLISPNLPAFRRYYVARNEVLLAREYYRTEREWVKRSLKTRLKEIVLVALFEDGKLAKFFSTALGLYHGLKGRIGKL